MYRPQEISNLKALLNFFFLKLRGIVAIIVCIIFIVFFNSDGVFVDKIRNKGQDYIALLYNKITLGSSSWKINLDWFGKYINAVDENIRLKREIEVLNSRFRDTELENKQYKKMEELLKIEVKPQYDFITTKVVADFSDSFNQSLMVTLSKGHKVKQGYAVVDENGLIGKIAEVSAKSAKILLITDPISKIPAILSNTRTRFIITASPFGKRSLESLYLAGGVEVEDGEYVVTSGEGGVFPPDLIIGKAYNSDDKIIIYPSVKWNRIEFVKILIPE